MVTSAAASGPASTARALVIAAAPVPLGALLWHPLPPGKLPDSTGAAEAAAADITRWRLSHLAVVVASAAVALAFVAVRGFPRERVTGGSARSGSGSW
jgi:hypothetical protein